MTKCKECGGTNIQVKCASWYVLDEDGDPTDEIEDAFEKYFLSNYCEDCKKIDVELIEE